MHFCPSCFDSDVVPRFDLTITGRGKMLAGHDIFLCHFFSPFAGPLTHVRAFSD